MTRLLTTTALLALLAAAPSWAQTGAPTTGGTATSSAKAQEITQQDRDFAKEAAIGGKLEVDLGKVAESKGENQAVKDFGKRMVDDHSKANDKFAALAKDLQLTLPTSLDQKSKDAEDRLSKLSGSQFDHDYIADMVKDHQEDIVLFQKETASGGNAQIKSFASDTLPMLQQHLKMAQDTQAKLGAAPIASTPGAAGSGASGTTPGMTQPGSGR